MEGREGKESMKDRFAGDAGRRIVLNALNGQKLISGNVDLANHVAIGELVDVGAGNTIIEQIAPPELGTPAL
jgi:hypothetical protein